jgi:signal peptidase I
MVRRFVGRAWWSLACVLLGVAFALGGIVSTAAGFHAYTVSSESMSPTFAPGELLVGQHGVAGQLRRGDLVLVRPPAGWGIGTEPILRRVIGTGGDRVSCCSAGRVVVDGQPLSEPYASSANGGMPDYSVSVPKDGLFLLGDNRADSMDSRMFLMQDQGSAPADAVVVRVVWTAKGGFLTGSGSLVVHLVLIGVGVLLFLFGLAATLVMLLLARRRGRGAEGSSAVHAGLGTPV